VGTDALQSPKTIFLRSGPHKVVVYLDWDILGIVGNEKSPEAERSTPRKDIGKEGNLVTKLRIPEGV